MAWARQSVDGTVKLRIEAVWNERTIALDPALISASSLAFVAKTQQQKVQTEKRYQKQYNDFSYQWFFLLLEHPLPAQRITCQWEYLTCKINLEFIFSTGFWGLSLSHGDACEAESNAGTMMNENENKTLLIVILFVLDSINTHSSGVGKSRRRHRSNMFDT